MYPEEETGTGWASSVKVRLFPRDDRINFVNTVHELVEPSIKNINMSIRTCPIPIHHYGKLDQDKDISKGLDYYELGRKKIEERGDDVDALRELAIQAGMLGKYDEAVDLWQRVLKIQPDMEYAYINLIHVYLQMNKFDDALTAARKALSLRPDVREVVCGYALCEMFAGDIERTVAIMEEVIKIDLGYPPAAIMLLTAYFCSDREDKGAAMIESLRGLGYSTATALADIVDNSISARATTVHIDFTWNGHNSRITILDNGRGMSDGELEGAMRLGDKNPLTTRDAHDLGRFGLGLKSIQFFLEYEQ